VAAGREGIAGVGRGGLLSFAAGIDRPLGRDSVVGVEHADVVGEIDYGADVGGDETQAVTNPQLVDIRAAHITVLFVCRPDGKVASVGGERTDPFGGLIGRKCFGAGVNQGEIICRAIYHGGEDVQRDVGERHDASGGRESWSPKTYAPGRTA